MYKLHYVRGINSYDTLQFASLSDQEDFFDDCIVGQPVDEYYPPLYKNKIKFAFDDISINNLQVNYLSLTYKGKSYYYFIDNINYISEDLWEFELTMDTIQTFMFDISKKGRVIRKSIKRWIDSSTINRNYVRENISKEDFDITRFDNYSTPYAFYLFAFSELEVPRDNVEPTAIVSDLSNSSGDWSYIRNNLYYFLVPVYTNPDILITTIRYNSVDYAQNLVGTLKHLLTSPYCVSCSLIRSRTFKEKVNIDRAGQTLYLYDTDNGITFNHTAPVFEIDIGGGQTSVIPAFLIDRYNASFQTIGSITERLYFSRNTSPQINFNKRYVPYLLDENYYKFEFGERLMLSQYPLHQITNYIEGTFNLKPYFMYDLESSFRNYKIYSTGDTYDKFFTIATAATQPTMILNKDSWEQYYANNKANYTIGIKNDIANIIWSNFTGTTSNVTRTAITGQNLRNTGMTQIWNAIDTENPQGIMSGANTMTSGHMWSSYGKAQAKIGLANSAIQMYNYGDNLNIVKENAISTPNYISQGNNAINDYYVKTFDLIVRESQVRDIENVAKTIEYYGYPVNEYYHENGYSGFVDFNNRLYYNICQMDSLILSESMVISDVLKADFIARLKSGIRLWNINAYQQYIGYGLSYDNVEKELISS